MRLTPDQDGHAPLGYHVNREVNMFFVAAEETESRKTDFYKPDPDRKQSEHTAVKHHQRHTEQFSTVKVLINSTETNWAN